MARLVVTTAGAVESRAEEELYNHYLKQMRIRDRATKNLENINKAREITGRVPVGMQIKVTPEVPASEDVIFKHEWAVALAEAEEILANCICKHLEKVADTIDNFILDKANDTLDTIVAEDPPKEGEDPFDKIKDILTRANVERQRVNDEMKKRKRENNSNKDSTAPPTKKRKTS